MQEQKRIEALKDRQDAIDRLKGKLADKSIRIGKTKGGKYGFLGWSRQDRAGMCDSCAMNAMKGSREFTIAKMQAEVVEEAQLNVGH